MGSGSGRGGGCSAGCAGDAGRMRMRMRIGWGLCGGSLLLLVRWCVRGWELGIVTRVQSGG